MDRRRAVSPPPSCRRHAALALELASELDPGTAADVSAEIDALAARLAELRSAHPRVQLAGSVAAVHRRIAPSGDDGALEDLLLHRALHRRRGHPLTLAIATVEAGRRAGIPLGVVGAGEEHYVAHAGLASPWVADPAAPSSLIDLSGRESAFGWRCAHAIAAQLLSRIATRAERAGDLARAERARELLAALPQRTHVAPTRS